MMLLKIMLLIPGPVQAIPDTFKAGPGISAPEFASVYSGLIPGLICYGLEVSRVQIGPGISGKAHACAPAGQASSSKPQAASSKRQAS